MQVADGQNKHAHRLQWECRYHMQGYKIKSWPNVCALAQAAFGCYIPSCTHACPVVVFFCHQINGANNVPIVVITLCNLHRLGAWGYVDHVVLPRSGELHKFFTPIITIIVGVK